MKMSCLKRIFLFIIYSFHLTAVDICLSAQQEEVIKKFLHASFLGSEAGYVLFGNKPVCCEGKSNNFESPFTVGHDLRVIINKGLEVWNEAGLPFEFSKFIIIDQQNKEGQSLVLFINRDAFEKTFYDNKALFQYALGSGITSAMLLDAFRKNSFFSVLKYDNALIGLLLGFGLANSLHVGRAEKIIENLNSASTTDIFFPFTFVQNKLKPPFKKIDLPPNLGFSSLQQEYQILIEATSPASDFLMEYSPKLYFSTIKNSRENIQLVRDYEETQLKIIELLNKPNWFIDLLSKLYQEPVNVIRKKSFDVENNQSKSDWDGILSNIFLEKIQEEDGKAEHIENFIEGMQEANLKLDAHYIAPFPVDLEEKFSNKDKFFHLGFKTWSFYKFHNGLLSFEKIIEKMKETQKMKKNYDCDFIIDLHLKTLENIEAYESSLALKTFQNLSKINLLKSIEIDRLYHHQISPGDGKVVNEGNIINVSYTIKTLYEQIIEKKENSSLDLRRAIQGFRKGFPGMREGDSGILYIHPKWGIVDYFTPPYFSPFIVVEFKINKIERS